MLVAIIAILFVNGIILTVSACILADIRDYIAGLKSMQEMGISFYIAQKAKLGNKRLNEERREQK